MSLNKRKETEDLKQHIRMYRGDRLKKEKKKNPDYRTLARYILGSTPSQARELTMKDSMGKVSSKKIEAYEELDEMQLGARMILEIGTFIHVPTDVTNCACVHLYAFYKENSITDYDYHFVAVACLFMACKTEDHPRALNDIVIAAYNCWNDKNCQHIKKRRQYLEQKLHELKTNLTKSSGTNIPGYPCGKSPNTNFETDSPHSYKSPGNSSSIGTPNSDFKSPASTSTLLTPQPTTPDESGSFIGASPRSPRDHYNYYNRGNLHGAAKMEIQKLKNEIQRTEKELKTMPLVRYLNPNNKKEFVIPPDDFFHQTKPKIEQHELELLSSIGFSTIVSLPHILIVDSKRKFQALYGECTVSKLERIVYVAYTLATRVISLFPVQKPRNHIAAALVYLCGPFTHPVEGKEWWKEIYGADMTEIELIQLSELICDAWTSSRDWFNQVHEKKRYFEPFWRKNTEYELNKPHAELSKPGMAVSKYWCVVVNRKKRKYKSGFINKSNVSFRIPFSQPFSMTT